MAEELVPKRKAKAAIWKYFGFKPNAEGEPDNVDEVICKLCREKVPATGGNTSNLHTHLRAHHKTEAAEMGPAAKALRGKPDRWIVCTDAVTKYLCKEMLSLNTIEKPSFQDLLTALDSQYQLPERTYFSSTAIPQAYTRVRKELEQAISAVQHFSLTADVWCGTKTTAYMSLTLHFIDSDWTLVSKCLQTSFLPEDYAVASVADGLREALREWGLNEGNMCCLTSNSGKLQAAARNYLGWPWLSCFGHDLELAVSDTVDRTEKASTDRALAVCHTINGMFSHSWRRRRELQSAQAELGLPKNSLLVDFATSWCTKQKMMERILEQWQAINRVLSDDRKTNVSLASPDRDVLQSLNKVLKLLSEFTDGLTVKNYVAASSLLPRLRLIKDDALAPSDEDTKLTADLKTGILSVLDEKHNALPDASRDLLSIATFMDPRYRSNHDPNAAVTKMMIKEEVSVLGQSAGPAEEEGASAAPRPETTETLASLLKRVVDAVTGMPATVGERVAAEIAIYAQESASSAEEDPLTWWKANQTRLPLLAKLAKKYLCVRATSSASERLFGTAGNMAALEKTLLEPEKLNMMVFLANNM